jgi:hypothetical protein
MNSARKGGHMKLYLTMLGLLGLLLIGCAVHSYLPFYNTAEWSRFYTGGDGSNTQGAIVINTTDDNKTVDAEDHYLKNMLTNQGSSYSLISRTSYNIDGRIYDKLDVVINQTTMREYHFDVTMPRAQTLRK